VVMIDNKIPATELGVVFRYLESHSETHTNTHKGSGHLFTVF